MAYWLRSAAVGLLAAVVAVGAVPASLIRMVRRSSLYWMVSRHSGSLISDG